LITSRVVRSARELIGTSSSRSHCDRPSAQHVYFSLGAPNFSHRAIQRQPSSFGELVPLVLRNVSFKSSVLSQADDPARPEVVVAHGGNAGDVGVIHAPRAGHDETGFSDSLSEFTPFRRE
jgi:hypothetical protein